MKKQLVVVVLVLLSFLPACDGPSGLVPVAERQREPVAQATNTPLASPTYTPPPISIPEPAIIPSTYVEAKVVKVVDGDTIKVDIAGRVYSVRYIGIDCPETNHPVKGLEAFGPEATARNAELVAGKTVRLETDVSETDRYDRLLRYVWVGDTMVNETLVREGYAHSVTYPPDVKHQELFQQREREAREASRGLWGLATPTARS